MSRHHTTVVEKTSASPPVGAARDPIAAFQAGTLSLEEALRASYFHTVTELQHGEHFPFLAITYLGQLDAGARRVLLQVALALMQANLAVKLDELSLDDQDTVDDALLAIVEWIHTRTEGQPLSRPPHPSACGRARTGRRCCRSTRA